MGSRILPRNYSVNCAKVKGFTVYKAVLKPQEMSYWFSSQSIYPNTDLNLYLISIYLPISVLILHMHMYIIYIYINTYIYI